MPPHRDPPLAEGHVHVRINAIVANAERGGGLRIDGQDVDLEPGDAVIFRPDLATHEVAAVDRGARLVWSVGCNLPEGRWRLPKRSHGRRRKGPCCR